MSGGKGRGAEEKVRRDGTEEREGREGGRGGEEDGREMKGGEGTEGGKVEWERKEWMYSPPTTLNSPSTENKQWSRRVFQTWYGYTTTTTTDSVQLAVCDSIRVWNSFASRNPVERRPVNQSSAM